MAVCRPHDAAPSTPQRTTGPNERTQASMARCPSPDTLWCAVPRTPPRPSITVVVTVRLGGSEPTTLPASASVTSTLERATPRLAIFRSPPWLGSVGGPADYIPVGAAHRRFYQVRPVPKARTEADTSETGHPSRGSGSEMGQASARPSTLGSGRPPSVAR